MDLKDLGFDNWFQDKTDASKLDSFRVARVLTVHKDGYLLQDENHSVLAELTGKFMFGAESALDYPAVGDWVYAQYFDRDTFAVIHEVFPRKSLLKRKTSGKKVDFQLIAANIDTAFIVQSLDANYNLRRLERYLAMINEGRISPVVLLSKSDLLSRDEIEEKINEIHAVMPNMEIAAFSNKNGSGLKAVEELLIPGKTFCLLGSSGVGKTTLLNKLLGESVFETREVREKDGRGRHTTTRRQLIFMQNRAMIIDTPGMRELGNMGIEAGIQSTFDEIGRLSEQCRYKDCTHTQEEGCAVLAAVNDGKISLERYQNYIKLCKESAYYESSYVEKRRKDKKFGKYCKSVMKHKVKK